MKGVCPNTLVTKSYTYPYLTQKPRRMLRVCLEISVLLLSLLLLSLLPPLSLLPLLLCRVCKCLRPHALNVRCPHATMPSHPCKSVQK
jgi:hypothetical protein